MAARDTLKCTLRLTTALRPTPSPYLFRSSRRLTLLHHARPYHGNGNRAPVRFVRPAAQNPPAKDTTKPRPPPPPPPQHPRQATTGPARDEMIRARRVRVRDEATGSLSPPQPLTAVLASIDRATHFVQQASRDPVNSGGGGGNKPQGRQAAGVEGEEEDPNAAAVVVRIISRAAAREEERAREREARARARRSAVKTLELAWATERRDRERKLAQAAGWVAEGRQVAVLLAPKRGTKGPRGGAAALGAEERARAEEMVREVRQVMEEAGGRIKKESGVVGGRVQFAVEPKEGGSGETKG